LHFSQVIAERSRPFSFIPVFATLPEIGLPNHFAAGATSGITKRLNRPPIIWANPCLRWWHRLTKTGIVPPAWLR